MKKKLLKPPSGNGDILFLPHPSDFQKSLSQNKTVCTCHQLSFFHPGIGIRFLFMDLLKWDKKSLIFMDTDRVKLQARVPRDQAETAVVDLINSENTLYTMKPILKKTYDRFFQKVENQVRQGMGKSSEDVLQNVKRYRDIIMNIKNVSSLREQLAESFIIFNNIESNYTFLSDHTIEDSFREFFLKIYHDDTRFRAIYNESLDQFQKGYRFRYKNYPFPKLNNDELPFWIVFNGKRAQLKKSIVSLSEIAKYTIFPKASPLTLFLRLHKSDIFVHGVGGANYEWVNDRILERFYQKEPPPYFVLSATFFMNSIPERDYPFFFKNPGSVRKTLTDYMYEHAFELLKKDTPLHRL